MEVLSPVEPGSLPYELVPVSQDLCVKTLKPLCLSSLADFEKGTFLSGNSMAATVYLDKFNLVDSWLGDLGFISPIRDKSVSGAGYFLRSCTKVVKDSLSYDGVKVFSGNVSSAIPGGHTPIEVPDRSDDSRALRTVFSLTRVSL